METKTEKRQTWLYLIGAVVLALLIILMVRSCRNDYGNVPPLLTDTLETGTEKVPPPVDEDREPMDGADTVNVDTVGKTPNVYPQPTIGNPPGAPGAAGPGGSGGAGMGAH
jgi:hypothetical protein